MRTFQIVLTNSVIATILNFTVWFAITFFAYLQTQSVLATSLISGIYLVITALTGIWFGSIVDHHRKKNVMIASSLISLLFYLVAFVVYVNAPSGAFSVVSSAYLWTFVTLLLLGVIAGNIRGIAVPTLVTLLVDEAEHDRANGLNGMVSGIGFMVTSVISGYLVGRSGMYEVLLLAIGGTALAAVHLTTIVIPEKKIVHLEHQQKRIDLWGTFQVVRKIPGMLALILFTTFNNFLGGVYMALMDAYGLSLVSVQTWGVIWGILSTAFIVGGIIISKKGLGKNPLYALFSANFAIWAISSVFTVYPSIYLLTGGMFVYLCVVPYIEAAEQTIIQKLVPKERQGRVFGFAQTVEQAASPITAFALGPIAQYVFIPFMTTGSGVDLIGGWFGVGPSRGIALVFTVTGILGLIATTIGRRSRYYTQLSESYLSR